MKHGVDKLDCAVVDYEGTMLPRAVDAMKKGQWVSEQLFNADTPQNFLRAIGVLSVNGSEK